MRPGAERKGAAEGGGRRSRARGSGIKAEAGKCRGSARGGNLPKRELRASWPGRPDGPRRAGGGAPSSAGLANEAAAARGEDVPETPATRRGIGAVSRPREREGASRSDGFDRPRARACEERAADPRARAA